MHLLGVVDPLRNIGTQICKKIVFGFWMDSFFIEFYENSIQSFRASKLLIHVYKFNEAMVMINPLSLLENRFGFTCI